MAAVSQSLNRVLLTIQQICEAHLMKPSFGYGPTSDFNAENQTKFPAIWVEPTQSRSSNTIQGVRTDQLALYIYALDRINKGDNNFQEIHSDMRYLLETIVAYIRESEFTRDQYIQIDMQDQYYDPVTRDTDENVNGWVGVKLLLRLANVYNPCNSPIGPITPQWNGLFNTLDAGVDVVIGNNSNIIINVIDAGVDLVLGPGISDSIINVIDASTDQVL